MSFAWVLHGFWAVAGLDPGALMIRTGDLG